jgi:autophagy-related protein 9
VALIAADTSLQRRFALAGLLNLLFAPVIVLYILVYSFFRYFEVSSCM